MSAKTVITTVRHVPDSLYKCLSPTINHKETTLKQNNSLQPVTIPKNKHYHMNILHTTNNAYNDCTIQEKTIVYIYAKSHIGK